MKNLPTVHVEGPDGSGKTTFAERLAAELGRPFVPTENPPSSWAECLARIAVRTVPGVVCDRSSGLVSELVYGPVFRGGVLAPGGEEELWAVVRAVAPAVVWVYCRPLAAVIIPTFRPGEPYYLVRAVSTRGPEILARYDAVMVRLESEARVVRYDWTRDDFDTTIRSIRACC